MKDVIQSFFDRLNANDYDSAFQLVDDAARWWVPGALPFSGVKTKTEYLAIARAIQANFPAGFRLTLGGMVAEGGKVAAEAESLGVHKNGRTYANKYHFLFEVRGGRIVAAKEYMDTQHLAMLIAPA